jgi:hypothetical protein
MFEGFGVARISPQLVYFLIFSCIAISAVNIANDERAWLRAQGVDDEDEGSSAHTATPETPKDTEYEGYGDYGDYKPA